jgi:O-antigen/teichoic acid export membrane protein
MRAHLSNATYGVLDYAAYPIGMLMVAPIVLRHLGVAQYGVWAVATAAVSTGSIIASGFGDANIQHVATQRNAGDPEALLRTVRSAMGIHLVLGAALTILLCLLAPYVARHVGSSDLRVQAACLWSMRIAGLLTLVRAIESVCISTQRAFERYGAAVRVSVLARLLALVAAAALASVNFGVVSILAVTALLSAIGLWFQLGHLKTLLHAGSLTPSFDRMATRALFAFGIFSWLQAVSGVIFSQTDRLITGISLGATTVAAYALCVQMAQPIYGFAASGLHFLFPYLAQQRTTASTGALRRAVLIAFLANVALVALGTAALLVFGNRVLRLWGGDAIAHSSAHILAPIVWSMALLGLNVTGTYAMLALGRVRAVTWLNLGGGVVMLLLIMWLLPHYGGYGVAIARLCYGPITLLLYIPLAKLLRSGSDARLRAAETGSIGDAAAASIPYSERQPAITSVWAAKQEGRTL